MAGIIYTTHAGSTVHIPAELNLNTILGVDEISKDNNDAIRASFRRRIKQDNRQGRALVSLAYSMAGTFLFAHSQLKDAGFRVVSDDTTKVIMAFDPTHPFVMCAAGQLRSLQRSIRKERSLLQATSALKQTLLYLAARCGFRDVTEMLLVHGAPINAKQLSGSTALHGASWYGHSYVVRTLLAAGADVAIKNAHGDGHTAEEEAGNDAVTEAFEESKGDLVRDIVSKIEADGGPKAIVRALRRGRSLIGYEIATAESCGRRDGWIPAYHGTRKSCLASIMRHGLKPAGATVDGTTIEVRPGHIKGTFCGKKDWGKAVFVSRSPRYACHPAYAETGFVRCLSELKEVHTLVRVSVKAKSYDTHVSTVEAQSHVPTEGESADDAELRIPLIYDGTEAPTAQPADPDDDMRVADATENVRVESVLLLCSGFVSSTELDMEEINAFILNDESAVLASM